VIGLTRFYCYQGEQFQLVDVPSQDAADETAALTEQGWDIEAAIPV